MVKNANLLITSALISSFFIGNIANAGIAYQTEELDSRGLGAKNTLNLNNKSREVDVVIGSDIYEGWLHYLPPQLTTDEKIDNYIHIMALQKKAFEEIGEGTLYPEERGYRLQQVMRGTKKAAYIGWHIAEPFVIGAGMRTVGNLFLSYAGPWLAEEAGKAASNAASAANHRWTKLDPTGWTDKWVRSAAKASVKGEVLRDLGTLMHYVEAYGIPTLKATYKATLSVAKAATSTVYKTYAWCVGWLGRKNSTTMAARS